VNGTGGGGPAKGWERVQKMTFVEGAPNFYAQVNTPVLADHYIRSFIVPAQGSICYALEDIVLCV